MAEAVQPRTGERVPAHGQLLAQAAAEQRRHVIERGQGVVAAQRQRAADVVHGGEQALRRTHAGGHVAREHGLWPRARRGSARGACAAAARRGAAHLAQGDHGGVKHRRRRASERQGSAHETLRVARLQVPQELHRLLRPTRDRRARRPLQALSRTLMRCACGATRCGRRRHSASSTCRYSGTALARVITCAAAGEAGSRWPARKRAGGRRTEGHARAW